MSAWRPFVVVFCYRARRRRVNEVCDGDDDGERERNGVAETVEERVVDLVVRGW